MTAIAIFFIGLAFVLHVINEQMPMRNKFITGMINNALIFGFMMVVIDLTVYMWRVAP